MACGISCSPSLIRSRRYLTWPLTAPALTLPAADDTIMVGGTSTQRTLAYVSAFSSQSGDAPTEKQAGFINALAKQTGEKVTIEGMDRADASSKIEDLLEKKDGGQTGAGAVIDRSEELKDDVSGPSPIGLFYQLSSGLLALP